jgi:broad specificity phosphatase PhoE
VSSKELTEWQEFARIEPFGEDRMDLRMAMIAYTMSTTVDYKGQRPKFDDFLFHFWEEKEEETPEQVAARIKAAFTAYGAKPQSERIVVPKGVSPESKRYLEQREAAK